MSFTHASAPLAGALGGVASGFAKRNSPRHHIADLKLVAHRDAIDPATPVAIRASLMRAYVDLQEIDMALRGQGKPKPVDAKNATKKAKRAPVTPITPSDKS